MIKEHGLKRYSIFRVHKKMLKMNICEQIRTIITLGSMKSSVFFDAVLRSLLWIFFLSSPNCILRTVKEAPRRPPIIPRIMAGKNMKT